MTFPVHIDLFGLSVDAHTLLEILAYSIGFQVYLRTRRRWPQAAVPKAENLWIVSACIFGALLGSKLLNIAEMPREYWEHAGNPIGLIIGGKTIVGGFIGGWIGVEIAKKRLGITNATGDAFVLPLVVGTVIGRIGCFLGGLPDATYGTATTLPWGVDFGDGVPRHPTQLYEVVAVLVIGGLLLARTYRPFVNGEIFRLFMLGYFTFRFGVEFVKPRETPYLGLSGIQVASLVAAVVCARLVWRMRAPSPSIDHETPHG